MFVRFPPDVKGAGVTAVGTVPESAQTADRAFQVLDAVARRGASTMAELVRETGLERRILGRLVGSLVKAGVVDRAEPDGRYELGSRLVELAAIAERRNGLLARARPVLDELLQTVEATTVLHRVHSDHIAPMLVLTPTDVLSVGYPMGRRIALHEGIGRAALAWLPADRVDEVLTTLSEDRRAAVEEGVAEVRRTGVALSLGEVVRGVAAVGAAVRNALGTPLAVVAVVAPEGLHPERFAAEVHAAARRIEA
jgi:DNA-binding IclR family transcriptional regulator